MTTSVLYLLLAIALIVVCGLFVAAEFSLITVSRAVVEREAQQGDRRARGVLQALRTLSTQLSGAQIGITLTNLAVGVLAEPAISHLLRPPLGLLAIHGGAATTVSAIIGILLATALTMIIGELVPKNLAIAHPRETAGAVQGFIRGFTTATAPIIRLFNGTANALLRLLGVEPQEELASARSAEELVGLVRRSATEGTLADETATLVERSLVFGDLRARDVMTPRTRMQSLENDATVADIVAASQRTGFSRFPVLSEDPADDEVAGVVHVRQALSVPFERRAAVPAIAIARQPPRVPESLEVDALLRQLRLGGQQLALVVDEFGGIAGLATLEDVVEELVGDVRDEHDQPSAPIGTRTRPGEWSLPGLLRIDEVLELTGIELPEHRSYDTIAGLVLRELGRIAVVGDEVQVEATALAGLRTVQVALRVTALDRLRIDSLVLRALQPTDLERHDPSPDAGSPNTGSPNTGSPDAGSPNTATSASA
jgi:CBS domain containing-hemolysin-like protein